MDDIAIRYHMHLIDQLYLILFDILFKKKKKYETDFYIEKNEFIIIYISFQNVDQVQLIQFDLHFFCIHDD
jgi:hypothetical protein